jgi:hypothetical protein
MTFAPTIALLMIALRARIVVVAIALGVGAAAWLAGDGGARAAIAQATGPLVAAAPGGAAVLVAQGLASGQERAGEVTVTNAGGASGAFALSTTDLTDSGAPLSGVLVLAVDDLTAGRGVYSGPLNGLGRVELGTLAQGEAHRYRFTVRFPGGRPASVDEAYQGASTAVTFVWSATSAVAVVTAGTSKVPRMAIGTALRQSGARGRVTTGVSCEQTCRIAMSGTAAFATRKQRLRTVHGRLQAAGRIRMGVALPRAARATVAAGRQVTVRLRAEATMGTRVVVTRRTILVARRR